MLRQSDRQSERAFEALRAVLPSQIGQSIETARAMVRIGGQTLALCWVGDGSLSDARTALEAIDGSTDTVAVGRRLSPGAREALSGAGVGWVDETGAAEIAFGSMVIARTGRSQVRDQGLQRWTPAVMAVAEALLVGTKPTVSATTITTGLSVGSCSNALRFLTRLDLLATTAPRGRGSARTVADPGQLLSAYAAAASLASQGPSLSVGVLWPDPLSALVETGEQWHELGVVWACTGVAAASVLAPLITNVTSTDVYIDTATIAGLESAATGAGLRPIEGGRLVLRAAPTVAVLKLATESDGLRVAPWPRVFVDLRGSGVRGEEAAEHLREVVERHGS